MQSGFRFLVTYVVDQHPVATKILHLVFLPPGSLIIFFRKAVVLLVCPLILS